MGEHLSWYLNKKKNSVNAVSEGVEMLLHTCALKLPNNIKKTQLKMMCASYNGNPSTTIISCNSPTNAWDNTTFYNGLFSLAQHIPNLNVLIIGGDMNVQIEKKEILNSASVTCLIEMVNI